MREEKENKQIGMNYELLFRSVATNLRHRKRRGASKAQEDIHDKINVLLEVDPKRRVICGERHQRPSATSLVRI